MFYDKFLSVVFAIEICSKEWVPQNTTELRRRFQTELIGQPLVENVVISSIISHVSAKKAPSKALVLSLHGTTGTGKTFVSQHIVESLYYRGHMSKFVKFYTSKDFMHDDPEHLRQYKDRLTADIENAAKACPQSTFIFDEIHLMPKQLFNAIIHYLEYYSPTELTKIDFRQTIFIFISNTGSDSIIELTSKFHQEGKLRSEFPLLEFEKSLSNNSFNEAGALWHTALIEQSLISFFVPFLPLQRQHVRHCIERELKRILDHEEEIYQMKTNVFVDDVLKHIEFISNSDGSKFEFARYGCKAVIQKTNTVFEMFRSKFINLGKKKQKVNDL